MRSVSGAADELLETVAGIVGRAAPAGTAVVDGVAPADLGLDSMAVARILVEVDLAFGVELSREYLTGCRGLADLAAHIAELRDAAGAGAGANGVAGANGAVGAAQRAEPFDPTPLQQAYLVGKHPDLGDDRVGCHLYREYEVEDLDVERLCKAWQRVTEAHDLLWTEVTDDSRLRVRVERPAAQLTVNDPDDPSGPDATVRAVRDRLSHRCYRPGQWPWFTAEVTRRPGGPATVHVSIDAFLIDGHGIELLLDQWWRCYQNPDGVPPLPPDGAGRAHLLALAARRTGPKYQADLEYWAGRLRDLPSNPPQIATPPHEGSGPRPRRARTGRFSAECWQRVRDLAAAQRVSPTALLLTLFGEAWRRIGASAAFPVVLTTSDRMRLPDTADDVVGPFTSTLVFVLEPTSGSTLTEAAAAVHARLQEDLDHNAVSGVEALRAARHRGSIPVVFTSMLDRAGAPRSGFGEPVYALSQTSGVALDHQMWERDGELRFRWDVTPDRFPPGTIDLLYAYFVNAVEALDVVAPADATDPEDSVGGAATAPLNPLQQAYLVARIAGAAESGQASCRVYQRFAVHGLDRERLEHAWLRLLAEVPALRSTVSPDGCLVGPARRPDRWCVPVLDLSDEQAAAALTARPFPLGRGPHAELCITGDPDGVAKLHLAVDLIVLDARSIRWLGRQLCRLYADPRASRPDPDRSDAGHRGPDHQDPAGHWTRRLEQLPCGLIPEGWSDESQQPSPRSTHSARSRRSGRLANWAAVRARASELGVTPDALLFTVFAEVLASRYDQPFALPVVRWTARSEPHRPGELTALSWLPRPEGGDLVDRARRIGTLLAEDERADAVSGLTRLRSLTMKARRSGPYAHPVVYTSIFDERDSALPDGVAEDGWLTATPDVCLDGIACDTGEDLHYHWDAVDDAFPPGVLDELFARYGAALERLAADPDSWTAGTWTADSRAADSQSTDSQIADSQTTDSPTTDREPRSLVERWNDTARPYPVPGPIHLLFEQRAAAVPGAVALLWRDGGRMTYGELNRRANRIAWHLIEAGVGPGTVVGVSGHRGPDLVAMVFGVLKAGGAYLPVEPHLPADRAAVMLRDADARLLLTRSGTRRWAEPDGVHAIDVDRLPEISDGREDRDPAPRARPDDTAYIIFTSGSTGTPKGVEVTHRPVHNLLAWCRRTFDFGPADVGLSVTSLGFDLSVFDVFGLLGCGAGIYLADEAEQRDPALLLDVLLNEPITFWNSAPTTLNQLAGLLPAHVGRPGTDRLRLVFLSGDYTPLPLPDEVRAVFPGARMVSLGGATEATVWSNYFVIDRVDPAWRSIPYGRPIDNARYYILDPDGRPCPVGVEGDLFIGGECLAIGYRKRPDLTAERFVRDPFRADPDARMYRTGDRAMFWADGTIEFLGRADHQVKIRGFRVELGEIEHRLREHPAVKDAVVLAKPDGTGDRKLVAYVIASGEPPAVSELRAFSARTLPDYMVPNYLAVVPSFPATANGKLDREALPWPLLPDDQGTAGLAGVGQDAVGPHTAIAAIFAELLGGVPVEPDADLWDQGATSFTMVQASARLQERFGRRIEVATLLSEPTIAGIARHFADSAPPVDTARPVDIAPTPATTPEPTAAPTPPRAPDSVDFFSTSARDAFKSAAWNLRPRRSDEPVLPLHTAPDDEHRAHRAKRRSRREFVGDPVPAATLSQLLDVLRTVPGEDGHTRARYPSAGDTYAVQTYLHLRPGGVDGLAPGLYYYRPDEPALHLIDPAPDLDRHLHFYYNRPLFDAAAFELYLVGQTKGIAPLYAERSELYLAVEAGYMGHLLMEAQPELGLGLCPIGALDEDRLAAALALDDGHRFLHAFLGGVVEPDNAVPDDNATPDNTVACAVPARLLAPSTTAPAPTATDAIAVIGACGRYPGADHLDDLWRLLHSGGHALGRPAAGRGDLVGGYLSDIESFDSLLFHVSPAEAATLDPQARLLLEAVWSCLENAGHTAASLRAGAPRVGVFVGVMWHDHQLTGWDELRATGRSQASSLAAELPNRISHCFDFTGPSVAVNTSCSSSLTALHLAAESLRHGQCDAAVVGAVNLIAHPFHGALLSGLDLLDPSGLGLAFGADSSGWVPAEGVGALLLRPEPAALAGRDRLHAVIESTWIGHSGHSVRYGAPNADALAGSVRAALLAAGRTPEEIDYVECAAAGAGVADAAELSALDTVFGGRSVPVGTVKPHVGHAEAAAGMAQIAKVLMQFRHRRLAPTLVAGRRSPLVGWDALGLRVVAEAEDFQPRTPGAPLRTLINSLGATGSYGHAVLRSSSADG